jgi:MFS transporter, ACS family, glucarate transporter
VHQQAGAVQVIAIAASVMFSCSMLRVNFSAAAPMIAADLNLTVLQLAYIHSAFLAGYLLGHVPAGLLADGKIGGARVLCAGATAWAVVTLLHASIALFPSNMTAFALAFLRFLVGATTAVAIPALAATIAQALPRHRRTHAMSTCYGVCPPG